MTLSNRKKALVIGATSGIGKGLAQILVKNNYEVGITGRREELLNDLVSENPNLYIPKIIDVCQLQDLEKSLDQLLDILGNLDLIIICAGYGEINKELAFEIEFNTLQTNVAGFTKVTNWAINLFEKQGYGHLVGITSIAGLRGNRYAPAYNASKAYQQNYLEGLRQKTKNTNIIITDIRPGFVDTAMAKGDGLFWVSTVNKAVKQIFKAINKRKNRVYISKRWIVIAVFLKIAPSWLYDRIS